MTSNSEQKRQCNTTAKQREARNLSGNNDSIPGDIPVSNPTAEILLAPAARARALRHGIHFGGVEEIDAGMEGMVEKAKGLAQRVLLPESHGS